MTTPLITAVQDWYCPACGKRTTTPTMGSNASRFHRCPKMRGLSTPLLRAGVKGKLELREREDYIGGELVRLDPERRRPVQSIVVTRDNGQDATVFAPTATLRSNDR